jgi:hypothetical protein
VAQETLALDMTEVDVSGFFTTRHRFETASRPWGELTMPAFSNQATFQTPGAQDLLFRKVHWLESVHEVSENGIVRGTADRRGIFDRDMVLRFDGREYLLRSAGLLNQGWYLVDDLGCQLLEVQPRGMLRQGAYLRLFDLLDIGLVAFTYYLVHVRWQEDAAVVAATAS